MKDWRQTIITAAEKEVTAMFKSKLDPLFIFHNLGHTRQVVKAAKELIAFYRISDSAQFVILIAAWFHDTGFISGKAEDHERESSRKASEFLSFNHVDQSWIQKVSSCILSTRIPQNPQRLEEKILCDADLYHLGTKSFFKKTDLLRQELQNYFKMEIGDEKWRIRNLEFLNSHKYFTGYCREKLEPVKAKWIEILEKG